MLAGGWIFLPLVSSATWQELEEPATAAGVPWGATPDGVKSAMKVHPGVIINEDSPGEIIFNGGELSGKPVEIWRFNFADGKMVGLNVRFILPQGYDARGRSYAEQLAQDIRRMLIEKFGPFKGQEGDNNYHAWEWVFPAITDHLDPRYGPNGGDKTVQLMWAWRDGHLEVIYGDHPSPALPRTAPTISGEAHNDF